VLLCFLTAAFFLSRTFVPLLYLLLGLGVAITLIARNDGQQVWSPSLPRLAAIIAGVEVISIVGIYLIVKFSL
jgi:hypothetical protein